MSTTLVPPEAAASSERILRIPPISANLLPSEVTEARKTHTVKVRVIVSLLVFTGLILSSYGVAWYRTALARDDVRNGESRIASLTRQQKAFNKLVTVQDESKTISSQLSGLMANDLQWSDLFASIRAAAPGGVKVVGLTASITVAAPGSAATSTNTLPSTSTDRIVGTVQITGSGSNKPVIASYVDGLGRVPGFANPILSGANQDVGVVQFTIQLDVTSAALGGRFTPKKAGK
jgi:hypothetical protein